MNRFKSHRFYDANLLVGDFILENTRTGLKDPVWRTSVGRNG